MEEIDRIGIPEERMPTKFYLLYDEKVYPPKYVISIANKYANARVLEVSSFNGGQETNNFLVELGFNIVSKQETSFPLSSHSWTILNDKVFIKVMDRSTFIHNGTAIPRDIIELHKK